MANANPLKNADGTVNKTAVEEFKKQNFKKIKESFENILPYGVKLPDSFYNDLPQALTEVLTVLQDSVLLDYPHKENDINHSYAYVKADINQLFSYYY